MTIPQAFRERWVAILREGLQAGYLIEYDGGYLLAEGDQDNRGTLDKHAEVVRQEK